LAYISTAAAEPDLFPLAQSEYLQGNWFETESLITRLLERNPGDVEARLLQVALLRQTGHAAEGLEQLRHLRTLTGSGRWQLELAREQELLSSVASTDPPPALPTAILADLDTPPSRQAA